MDWFTVEQLDECSYAISEYRHWEETHCYLLWGAERAVLIDTGLGVSDIKKEVDRLTALPVTVLTTHVHWDHIGGHKDFQAFQVHEAERDWISKRFPIPLQAVKQNLACRPCDFPDGFSLEDYRIFQGVPEGTFHDGSGFDLGGRRLVAIHTPGHSPGHCCFWEPGRRWLYSGDLIYKGCLDAFYPTTDPGKLFQSVKKVQALGAERVWPGHHSLSVSADLVDAIEEAFAGLEARGLLRQGAGVFDFGEFQIHL